MRYRYFSIPYFDTFSRYRYFSIPSFDTQFRNRQPTFRYLIAIPILGIDTSFDTKVSIPVSVPAIPDITTSLLQTVFVTLILYTKLTYLLVRQCNSEVNYLQLNQDNNSYASQHQNPLNYCIYEMANNCYCARKITFHKNTVVGNGGRCGGCLVLNDSLCLVTSRGLRPGI